MTRILEAALFGVVLIAFAVAIYARHRMMQEERRPGYVPDMTYRHPDGTTHVADWKTDEDRDRPIPPEVADLQERRYRKLTGLDD